MHAVVSLLDDNSSRMVEKLWAEIEKEFGIRGIYRTAFPHISYHLSSDYNVDKVKTVMEVFAEHISPFRVRCCGLGVFTGPKPVLYIPVVRSPQLSEFQDELWHHVTKSSGPLEFTLRPSRWIPHIKLAEHDLTPRSLAAIVRKLSAMELNHQVTINNLSLLYDTGDREEVFYRVNLSAKGGGAVGPGRLRTWGMSKV